MILIDGKKEAANLREELKKEVSQLKTKYSKVPGLTVILNWRSYSKSNLCKKQRKICKRGWVKI